MEGSIISSANEKASGEAPRSCACAAVMYELDALFFSLCIGGFPYGSPHRLYANEHSEVLSVKHWRLCSSREMGYTINPSGSIISSTNEKASGEAPISCACAAVMYKFVISSSFVFLFAFVMPKLNITRASCTVTMEEYTNFVGDFQIPSCYELVRPDSHHTALDIPSGYIVLYLSLFTVGNFPYRTYGGEPTWSLFRFCVLGSVGDWLTFQKCLGHSIPSIFKTLTFSIPGWKSKFIIVYEGLFSDQHPSLVTSFRHGLGTFNFPLPSEPFDIVLQSQMTLKNFLYFLGDCSAIVVAVPNSGPLSIRSPDIIVVNLFDEDVEMLAAGLDDENVEAPPLRVQSTSVAAHDVQRRAMLVPALINPSSKRKEVVVSPSCGSKRRRSESLGGGPSPVFMGRHVGFRGPLASSEETGEIYPFFQRCLFYFL
ncbi:hypothetical protein Tco_0421913 [Tanacetum coccineum]